jgi:hypothetical protein
MSSAVPTTMNTLPLVIRICLLAIGVGSNCVAGAAEPDREDQFKGAYLLNFLKFVEWPASAAKDVLTVCFIGGEGVRQTLETGLDDKRAGARRLAARQLEFGETLAGCNAVYAEGNLLFKDVRLAQASDAAVLTVSDAHGFTSNGGMIGLFIDGNRLRFSINVDNTQRARLRVSSSLLKLASQVESGVSP